MTEIDKNISIPENKNSGIFKKMEISDSVFIKNSDGGGKMQSYCHSYGRLWGKKFKTKSVDGGVRIWRIE